MKLSTGYNVNLALILENLLPYPSYSVEGSKLPESPYVCPISKRDNSLDF
jgi:hypothetical protein